MKAYPLLAAAAALALSTAQAAPFDHEHARFGAVLAQHVASGAVDYAAIKAQPAELVGYLDELAAVGEPEFKSWSSDDQLAFLINLYNAATINLIVDHYPVKRIKDIGSLLNGPWDQTVVRLWGSTMTLNNLEHDTIRKRYDVPEIHFALVCAAKGCPQLRGEPYTGAKLRAQLADQRDVFLSTASKNSLDIARRMVRLSPIFKWYGGDFDKTSGSLAAYLKLHWPGFEEDFAIRYTSYDWSLNEP